MTIKMGCLLHYSGIAGNKTGLWDGKQLHWGRRIMRPSLYPLNLTHSPLPGRVARSLEWHYLRWRSHAQPYTEHSGWGGVMWKAASAGPSERIEAPCLKLPSPAVSHALWYLWRTRGEKKKNVTSNSFYSLPLLTSSSREPLKKMWPVTSFVLIGLSSTYGCHTILRYNQETKKNKARVEKRVEGDRKRKGKKMRKKTNTWRFIKFLHRKTF